MRGHKVQDCAPINKREWGCLKRAGEWVHFGQIVLLYKSMCAMLQDENLTSFLKG